MEDGRLRQDGNINSIKTDSILYVLTKFRVKYTENGKPESGVTPSSPFNLPPLLPFMLVNQRYHRGFEVRRVHYSSGWYFKDSEGNGEDIRSVLFTQE